MIAKEKILGDLADHLLGNGFFLEEAVEILEKALIERGLTRTEGNQSAASKLLGIHRNTLQRKMDAYQLDGRRPKRKPLASAKRKAIAKAKRA